METPSTPPPGDPPIYVTSSTPLPPRRLPPKDPGIAVLLELLPGLLLGCFGIGNLYAGNIGAGIAILIGYWILLGINILLCFVCIGFLTLPLTVVGVAIGSTWLAYDTARRSQIAYLEG